MSLSPTSRRSAPRADSLEWPDLGPLRWPYLCFTCREFLLAAYPAVCLAEDGVFWEYDGPRFLVTDGGAGTWRRPAGDREDVPCGPWRHVLACVCDACRLGDV